MRSWASEFTRSWRKLKAPRRGDAQAFYLQRGIELLSQAKLGKGSELELLEQPFDRHLLQASALFKRSRELYVKMDGKFRAALVSSPRTLSSAILLENLIEYTPIESELVWSATDPIEKKNLTRLMELRTFTSSLYHEQNHRILWQLLPPAPREDEALSRYLNFAEALVITLDMALGDELGMEVSAPFYLSGVLYDPGTTVREELGRSKSGKRAYRNYLQAALHTTYLNLELYELSEIPRAIEALYPGMGEYSERACRRASNLDREFITRTNLAWKLKHLDKVKKALCRSRKDALVLPEDPMDNRAQYMIAEQWFDVMEL